MLNLWHGKVKGTCSVFPFCCCYPFWFWTVSILLPLLWIPEAATCLSTMPRSHSVQISLYFCCCWDIAYFFSFLVLFQMWPGPGHSTIYSSSLKKSLASHSTYHLTIDNQNHREKLPMYTISWLFSPNT